MLMTSKTAEGGNHGVQLMETDHSKSGGELQSLSQHVTDMRNPFWEFSAASWLLRTALGLGESLPPLPS